ncbi:hypothetical protein V7Y83_01080 [Candidatus Carsonella ruddii]|uniref:hypothetical protein n=1 Tax=Carsonella ruddii TaxID=114186 RepID=UPI003D814BC9
MNNLDLFIKYCLENKFNFCESIDLSILFNNKKKNYFSFCTNLFYSVNDKKKFLFLSDIIKKENNIYYGNSYFYSFLKKEIVFEKIYSNLKNISLIKKNTDFFKNKFTEKKCLLDNYDKKIKEITNKILKVKIDKNNFLNVKIGNVFFDKNMITKNYFTLINNLKKVFFCNNIYIEKIYISTTMSKSYLIK